MARWKYRIQPKQLVGQSLPILLLFVLGMLCGTLWNRSGRSVQQQNPTELVPAFAEERNNGLQVVPINVAEEPEERNLEREREREISSEKPKYGGKIGVSQRPWTEREEVDVVSEGEKSTDGDSTDLESFEDEDVDYEEERIFKREVCIQEALVKSSSIRTYNQSYALMLNSLKCGKTVVYTSYDHEGLLLNGQPYSVTHHTGQFYGPPLAPHTKSYQILRNDIIESLLSLSKRGEDKDKDKDKDADADETKHYQNQTCDYYYGVPIPACAEGLQKEADSKQLGGNISNLLVILSQLKDIDLGLLSYSDLFTHMSYDRSERFFRAVLKEFESAYLISFLDSIRLGEEQPQWKERVIQIPSDSVHHWSSKREDLLDRLATFVELLGDKHENPPIILVSAGILTNVLIHEMHLANNKLSYVAVDGLFDVGHAAFVAKPEHQFSENGTLTGGETSSCTMASYVREGDCVKAVGDKELSPLCYSKGAKGKPVAGRIGGFFPHDHERKQSIERQKKELERKKKEEKLMKKRQAKLAKKEREKEEEEEEEEGEVASTQQEQNVDLAADTGATSPLR